VNFRANRQWAKEHSWTYERSICQWQSRDCAPDQLGSQFDSQMWIAEGNQFAEIAIE